MLVKGFLLFGCHTQTWLERLQSCYYTSWRWQWSWNHYLPLHSIFGDILVDTIFYRSGFLTLYVCKEKLWNLNEIQILCKISLLTSGVSLEIFMSAVQFTKPFQSQTSKNDCLLIHWFLIENVDADSPQSYNEPSNHTSSHHLFWITSGDKQI